MSDLRVSSSRPHQRTALVRRLWPLLAGLALAGLMIAWIDGGERALRPISEAVELPAASRSGAR
jgi:hypothetical protein